MIMMKIIILLSSLRYNKRTLFKIDKIIEKLPTLILFERKRSGPASSILLCTAEYTSRKKPHKITFNKTI